MKFIQKIQSFLHAIPKKYVFLLLFTTGASQVFAQSIGNDDGVIRWIIQIVNLCHMVLTFLITPLIILAGWLLSPDWTMGDIFWLRPYFLQVWILVSNITYIAFAFLLFFMAVMQIFSWESKYAFKTKLPRFLVGILIVPFSWLIVSWTLSIVNQLTASILSIPTGAIEYGKKDSGTKLFLNETIPTKIDIQFENRNLLQCMSTGKTAEGDIKCISPAQFISENQSWPYFIMLIYAYDIFRIQETDLSEMSSLCGWWDKKLDSTKEQKTCVKEIGDFLQKVGLALVTYVFFAFLVIALCFVLLARALKLWIYVMLSPLFGLAYALEDEGLGKVKKSEGWWGGGEGVSIGELGLVPFFKLALVPVLVTAVLSFGILFLGVMRAWFSWDNNLKSTTKSGDSCLGNEFTMVKFCLNEIDEEYSSYLEIGNSESKDSKITFYFGDMMTGEAVKKTLSTAGDARDALTDIFAHGILSIVGLVIIWAGIKAAVNYDEVTSAAFRPFAKLWDAVWYAVKEAPSYIPLPHPVSAIAKLPSMAEGAWAFITRKVDDKKREAPAALTDILSGKKRDFDRAVDRFKDGTETFQKVLEEYQQLAFRDPESAKKAIKTGLQQINPADIADAGERAKFEKFQRDIEQANSSKQLQKAFSDNREIVNRLNSWTVTGLTINKDKMVGLANWESAIGWLSSSAPTGSSARITIGKPTVSWNIVTIKNSSSSPAIEIDRTTKKAKFLIPSYKQQIKDALQWATSQTELTDEKLNELFWTGHWLTLDDNKAIVTEAKI